MEQMYKVFINEKSINVTNSPIDEAKNIRYEGAYSIEMAIDVVENSATDFVNIYGENPTDILDHFSKICQVISAAGGIVKNELGEILFIYRLGKWDLPKGKLEKGETEKENALREVQEETGLTHIRIDEFAGSTFHIYKNDGKYILKKSHWYLMAFFGNEKPIPQTEEGITKVEWKNKNDIQKEVFPNTFGNIALILKQANCV